MYNFVYLKKSPHMQKKWVTLLVSICILSLSSILSGQADSSDLVFGHYRILQSQILDQDRLLYVNLPDNYQNSDKAYPVVFQLYSHFLYNYYLPVIRSTTMMATMGEAPDMIVVGIMNREFRYRDLLPEDHWGGTSEIDSFLDFFQMELIPFLKSRYRIENYSILSGPQAGAAFGLYALCERPQLFNAVIISNPFWIKTSTPTLLEKFQQATEQNDFTNKFLMITYGNHIDADAEQALDTLTKLTKSIHHPGFEYHLNLIEQGSAYTAPTGIEAGLKRLFNDFSYPQSDSASDLAKIELYYKNISEKLGYKVAIPELALVYEGDHFINEENPEKALEIYLKMYELYPEGLMAYDRLGSVYYQIGELDKALEYYDKFLERQAGDPRVKSIVEGIKKERE
jgi:predicted alpha/beta superfamily hydrolase